MGKNRNQRIQELFVGALDFASAEQEEWLRSECGDDQAMLDDVLALLRHDQATTDPLERGLDRELLGDAGLYQHPDQTESSEAQSPVSVGRYQIDSVLGKGGFGLVYKAYDEQLQRHVAVKVPHAHLVNEPADADAYLAEARTVASLDHPNIVPVHDVGQSEEFPCYVVSRFVEGTDLSERIKQQPLSIGEAVELVATIAEALHYAHKQGLVHRDVKPGNILLGNDGKPYLVDFGLALKEQKVGTGTVYAGTPAYMSPEQARGEGHRVDGRSDIYSLGVVLYELLVGQRTFRADSAMELLKKISSLDVKPPRQINDAVPGELERICLKALSRKASDRYTTALDMADDLRHFQTSEATESLSQTGIQPASTPGTDSTKVGVDSKTPKFDSDSQEIRVVPKGLRSFDAHDADFFLELLPGPRDRDGLPDSIRFWKTKIEESDPDNTFSVGLIYGPSGCGKSSLMKAGLLPRLSDEVIAVYVEATPEETESRLLHGLCKACPNLDSGLDLTDTLTALRQGQGIVSGKKVLIVLDQFEQWLHAKKEQDPELVQALRQCDGAHVQCVVMVRDDFWLAVSRFLRELEVPLVEGENSALADLFDPVHAQKVLSAFGRAFGRFPYSAQDTTKGQTEFIKQSVAGLAEEGKVICVRLALFAEMMKGKPWTPETLVEVGGTSGVGVTFLEETFSASTAPPEHRYHQKAARAVLKSLLPDSGTNIKGHMRSRAELLETSSYEDRPLEFDDVVRILDSEIRLITPTDPEGHESDDKSIVPATVTGAKYYQLTHDYLVPSLRDWLTCKQKETRQGRAELALADRAAVWSGREENRQLPSLQQWLQIRRYTRAKNWSEAQQRMMARAAKVHGFRTLLACALIFVVVSVGFLIRREMARGQEETRIQGLVNSLINAEPDQLPAIVAQLDERPGLSAPLLAPLVSAEAQTADEKRARLHASLAAVSRDPSLVEGLKEEMLTNKVAYVGPIRELLRPYADELNDEFRTILRNKTNETDRRFRAAIALADYASIATDDSWTKQDLTFVARRLVSSNAEFQPLLRRNLQPISQRLLPDLEVVFRDGMASDAQRLGAANALADIAGEDTELLSNLLTFATPEQFSVLYPIIAANPAPSTVNHLAGIAADPPPDDLGAVQRIAFGQRRANAAVSLLRLGQPEKVLPVFEWSDDPEALTQFVFRCRERNVGVEALLECLELVSSARSDQYPKDTRYALLLALGEFTLEEIPESRREKLLTQIADWYANDPSSGVHGAAGWLLRHWGQSETANKIEQTEVPYSPDREWFTLAITVTPTPPPKPENSENDESDQDTNENDDSSPRDESDAANDENPSKQEQKGRESEPDDSMETLPTNTFYYTFIVVPPGKYWIGSVADEPERGKDETHHHVKLTRPVAVLDREITFEELIAFSPIFDGFMKQYDASSVDAGFGAHWYDSVGFCRWLGKQMGFSEGQLAYASPDSLDEEQYPREPDPSSNWAPRNWPVELGSQGFRLPTEGEWEVVARAGSRTAYGFGSDASLLGHFGWFVENSGKHVHPARELRPSLHGVFDVHGNLYEWTHDWKRDYESKKVTDPLAPQSGSLRVFRGGGWDNGAADCRTANRNANAPTSRMDDYGFRLALSPSVESPEARIEEAEPKVEGTEGASAEQRPEMP